MGSFFSIIFGIVFALSILLCFASLLYGLAELIGTTRFQAWAFEVGPIGKVAKAETECPVGFRVIAAGETEQTKYRVLEGNRCLFRKKYDFMTFHLGSSKWKTPFDLKGIISWEDGRLTIEGRYPLGPILFLLCWIVGFTSGGLMVALKGGVDGRALVGLLLIGLCCLFIWGLYSFIKQHELDAFCEYAAEVEAALMKSKPPIG